jgi:putative nucleotidyltransferase with HDIG domain
MNETKLPTVTEAEEILLWGYNNNPGPWLDHSKTVARASKTIALKCGLDDNLAYILGLLHDIGRYEGITGLRHVYAGYDLMIKKGYTHNAKICWIMGIKNRMSLK